MIRALRESDIEQLKAIHEKYYKDQFNFPDFFSHYLNAFVVVDNDDRVISAGGVRTNIELLAITDRERTARRRVHALTDILECAIYTAKKYHYNTLNVFASDRSWQHQLKRAGFEDASKELFQLGL